MYDRNPNLIRSERSLGGIGVCDQAAGNQAMLQAQCIQQKERPELACVLAELESTVSAIERMHRDLLDRLNPVLRPQTLNECASGSAPRPVRSPVADELEALESRLRGECAFISDLLSRLAV